MNASAQLIQLGGLHLEDETGIRRDIFYRFLNLLFRKRTILSLPKGKPEAAKAFAEFLERYARETGARPGLAICGNVTSLGGLDELQKYEAYRDTALRPHSEVIVDIPGLYDLCGGSFAPHQPLSLPYDVFAMNDACSLRTHRHLICLHPLASFRKAQPKMDYRGYCSSEELERIEQNINEMDFAARKSDLRAVHLLVTFHSPRMTELPFGYTREAAQRLLKFCLQQGISGILCKLGSFPIKLAFPSMNEIPWPPETACPDAFVWAPFQEAAGLLHEFEDLEPAQLRWRVRSLRLEKKPYRFKVVQSMCDDITL